MSHRVRRGKVRSFSAPVETLRPPQQHFRFRTLLGHLLQALRSRLCRIMLRGVRPAVTLTAAARCVTGPVRHWNHDRCYVDPRGGLFVIADGAGEQMVGECASQLVIEVMAERLGPYCRDQTVSAEWLDLEMQQAIRAANAEIVELAQNGGAYRDIGTTVVAAAVRDGSLLLASVGDSRAYLARGGTVLQLTEDDTVVQSLLSAGAMTPKEAARHPMRHVLLHHVGTQRLRKELHVKHIPIQAADRVLLATDGLTDAFDPDELPRLLQRDGTPQEVVNEFVDRAIQAGARDNITCVVIDVHEPELCC